MPAGIFVPTFPQRSPPSLLTTAACGGLRSTPDCRPRRAALHLSYSYASPCGPALLVTQDPDRTGRFTPALVYYRSLSEIRSVRRRDRGFPSWEVPIQVFGANEFRPAAQRAQGTR